MKVETAVEREGIEYSLYTDQTTLQTHQGLAVRHIENRVLELDGNGTFQSLIIFFIITQNNIFFKETYLKYLISKFDYYL